jgi:quercetin dioxygenase-like cupin family protein
MTDAGRQVTVVRPERGQTVRVAGMAHRVVGTGAGTDGSYVLLEVEVAPGGGAPAHMHAREEEGFYILEGEIDFTAAGATLRAGPGAYLNMPKTTPHSFLNNTDRPARMLVLCAPAGIEHFFMEADDQPPEALAEIAARHGITILPPD